jgi:flagellar motor switch protein FliG
MARFREITPKDVSRVANEFYRVAEKGRFLPASPQTKVEYLRKILTRALGDERASEMLDGLVARRPESALEQLKWHDPKTIADFLIGEHPQVIAVILSNLGEAPLAHAVIGALPVPMQQDILTRFARLREIPQEWLDEIEATLGKEITAPAQRSSTQPVGEVRMAEVLESADKPVEDALIKHLERRNPDLAERIRKRLFSFPDLLKIDNYGIQLVLQRISGDDLVQALKLSDEMLKRHFLRNMAADSAEQVEQAILALGPTPISRIEAAQKRIAGIARGLIESGEIFPLKRRKSPPT